MATSSNKQDKINKLISAPERLSRGRLLVFAAVFAVIGAIILIKSFAAPNPNLPGDLNGDNVVNVTDLSILLTNYGTGDTSADINGDGTVNVLDLSILLSNYGQSIVSKPSIPTGLTATAGDGSVSLKWNANPTSEQVDVYQVYLDGSNYNLSVVGTSLTVTGLTNGTPYNFRVSAHNNAGYGDWSSSVSATPSGSGGGTGTIPTHIETWAYDGAGGGGNAEASSTPGSLIRQWATYVEGAPSVTKAVTDCHGGTPACKAMAYLDTNLIYTVASCGSGCSVPIWGSAQENWWLHQPGYTDSSHRLTFTSGSNIANRLNPNVTAVGSWFKNYLNSSNTANSYDGLFMDDTPATLSDTMYMSGFSSSQEETTDAQVQAGHSLMSAALTHTDGTPFIQINNGVPAQSYLRQLPALQQAANSSNVIGLISEGAPQSYVYNGMIPTLYYGNLLDTMGYVDHSNLALVLLGQSSSANDKARRVQTGTVWLGYMPGRIVDWADLEFSTSNLAIWPEEGIYPTQPLTTMSAPSGSNCLNGSGSTLCTSGGHNDIQVAPGVYRREFAACYNQGVLFGRCATIVNSTTAAVTVQSSWLSQSYAHQVTFNGGDVGVGGTVNLSGAGFAAGSTSIAAQDAILLAP